MKVFLGQPSVVLLVAMVATSGCVSTRPGNAGGDSTAVLTAASRLHDEQISKLTFKVNQLKDDNAVLKRKVRAVSDQVAGLKANLAVLERENAALKNRLAAESSARKRDMDVLLKKVAAQVATAVNAAARASRRQSRPAAVSRPSAPAGEFYEYVVESGATLSAIAKAYKVSVSSIKRANNLKGDNIRIGQKLLIPKRK